MNTYTAMCDELKKIAGVGDAVRRVVKKIPHAETFIEGAKGEFGPAVGAVLGAGTAKVLGVNPLAGAAAGYGLGALPGKEGVIHALRHRGEVGA